eukprot:747916-Hanusia_phi.AAC.2
MQMERTREVGMQKRGWEGLKRGKQVFEWREGGREGVCTQSDDKCACLLARTTRQLDSQVRSTWSQDMMPSARSTETYRNSFGSNQKQRQIASNRRSKKAEVEAEAETTS